MNNRRTIMLTIIGLCVMALCARCLADTPHKILREALTLAKQGRHEQFVAKVRESLTHEWQPSIYGPDFTLAAVPPRDLGNVSFSVLREVARSLRDRLAQRPVQTAEARLVVDYMLKLVRSRSPQPDIYFSVILACWTMLERPLAQYVEKHGTEASRTALAALRELNSEDVKYLRANRQQLESDQQIGQHSQLGKYAAKRLPVWERRLINLQRQIEPAAGHADKAKR